MSHIPKFLADGEKLEQCPYDNHLVLNTRMPIHIDKCKRNYIKKFTEVGLSVDTVRCRFNCGSVRLRPEIEFHEANCDLRDALGGNEALFDNDKEALGEYRKLLKLEKEVKMKGFVQNKNNIIKKDGGNKSGRPPQFNLGAEDIDWDCDSDEEDWGKEGDSGVVFSMFKRPPLLG